MAELIVAVEDKKLDRDGVSPFQFECTKSGCGAINTRAFSRLRDVSNGASNVLG